MNARIEELLDRQAGVVSRAQLLRSGLASHDVRRLLRRRDLVKLYGGVYLNHTGTPTWLQHAWAAVLAAWPAALCHQSAIRAANGPGRIGGDARPIHVAVDRTRSLDGPPNVTLHRVAHLDRKALWNLSPPRLRIEEALVDVAAEAETEFDTIATFANAIQARRTTASRIRDALDGRLRIKRRDLMCGVLNDMARGSTSVLEHGYLTLVERPHGLPDATRQSRGWSSGRVYRDVEYDNLGVIVELDGRQFHDNPAARDRDLDRDLDAVVDGATTVRLGWGQVFKRPCATAERLAVLLTMHGWDGMMLACPNCATTALRNAANM